MDDMISRQAAIDALDQIFDRCEEIEAHLPEGDPDRTGYKMYPDYMTVWKYLHQLPSAQQEQLTDKEQRIFLAAMGREEKVCKQVDDEYRDCMEPYEDSLVRTCHEITRKVKGALWT